MFETKNQDVEKAIAELTGVGVKYVQTAVYLYGRPHGFAGPTKYKAASVWLLWKPFDKRPAEKIVTLIKGTFTATREGESPDHLIEIPRAHAMVLDVEGFLLTGEQAERVKARILEQRGF
jgi:hypothetical protein